MLKENKTKGNFIESQVAGFLMREGYEILARNYAYHGGEIDIVAREGETIVFVEPAEAAQDMADRLPLPRDSKGVRPQGL